MSKRRILVLSVSIVLILCLTAVLPKASAVVSPASGTWGNSITWTLDAAGTLTVSGSGDMPYCSIMQDVPWDQYRSNIKQVIISNGITSIANRAFSNCTRLTTVGVPYGLKHIDEYAFYNCKVLQAFSIPGSVERIGISCFEGCAKLSYMNIPDSLERIPDFAFQDCISLLDVYGGGGLTEIGSHAFSGCTKLNSVTTYSGLGWIGTGAFEDCSALYSILIPSTVQSVDKNAFRNSGLWHVTISCEAGAIGKYAFADCAKLKSVTVNGESVYFRDGAFSGCTSLASVTLPSSLIAISNELFSGCSSLESIIIPEQVLNIGDSAFSDCRNLKSVDVPASVASIGEGSFYGCDALETVTLREGLQEIGAYAFAECTAIESITIPATVEAVLDGAFCGCSSLRSVTVESETTEFGEYVFYGCGGTLDVSWVHTCAIGDTLSLVYYAALPDAADFENLRLEIEQDKYAGSSLTTATTVITDYTLSMRDGTQYLRFSYDGITSPEIGCECRAVLKGEKDGGHFVSEVNRYSISDYAYHMLDGTDPLLKTLCVDLLNFGAEAQRYFNYNAANPVNADLTPAQLALGSHKTPRSCVATAPIANPTAYIRSVKLNFGNATALKFFFTLPADSNLDSITLEMSYDSPIFGTVMVIADDSDLVFDADSGMYFAMLENVSAVDYNAVITIRVMQDGTQISDMKYYSIESYCCNMISKNTDPALARFCRAVMNYNSSAYAYFTANLVAVGSDLISGTVGTVSSIAETAPCFY